MRRSLRSRRHPAIQAAVCDALESRTLFATFTVTTVADAGAGSLRQAILNANATAATDTIQFNIPGAGAHTIAPLTELPTITKRIVIDATTEPGYAPGSPKIVLDGNAAALADPGNDDIDGLTISAGKSEVRGLVINRWTGDGIELRAGNCKVQACFIGTNFTGLAARPNGRNGIHIVNTGFHLIGGEAEADRNVISANDSNGIYMTGGNAAYNVISGNYIGLGADGLTDLGNFNDGIRLSDGANHNTFGGTTSGARNVISGHGGNGIFLYGEGTDDNRILGNYIGTTANGKGERANAQGIRATHVDGLTIGGDEPGARNVISGNGTGISIGGFPDFELVTDVVIQGNYVGVKPDGATVLPNNIGISAYYVSNVRIGGLDPGEGNVISGNTHHGLAITDFTDGAIEGNHIGVDKTGNLPRGNGGMGVAITGDFDFNDNAVRDNVISANADHGLHIGLERSRAKRNVFQGNFIGTNHDGTIALGNGGDGLVISGEENLIGGAEPGQGNVISANGGHGIVIGDDTDASGGGHTSDDNQILGNRIGTDAAGAVDFGNGGHGVWIRGFPADGDEVSVRRTRIGNSTAAGRNVISGNAGYGVLLDGETVIDTRLRGNYIGADATGTVALPNNTGVVLQNGASANRVGGEKSGQGNVISGNFAQGVLISSDAAGNVVRGNRIGTAADGASPLGNGASGVNFTATAGDGNTIGYNGNGIHNVIAYNGGAGIRVNGGVGQAFWRNSIFNNTGLGIDLGGPGVTPNDAFPDADVGPNNLLNFPVLTSAAYDDADETLTINGTLDATPSGSFTLQLFSDTAPSAADAEGRTYLGSIALNTNAQGHASFSVPIDTNSPGTFVTALVVTLAGDTSEFSAAIAVS